MKDYRTPDQIAADLPRFSSVYIQRQCRTGKLRASKIGGKWLITPDDLEEFIASGSNEVKARKRRRRNITSPEGLRDVS